MYIQKYEMVLHVDPDISLDIAFDNSLALKSLILLETLVDEATDGGVTKKRWMR